MSGMLAPTGERLIVLRANDSDSPTRRDPVAEIGACNGEVVPGHAGLHVGEGNGATEAAVAEEEETVVVAGAGAEDVGAGEGPAGGASSWGGGVCCGVVCWC